MAFGSTPFDGSTTPIPIGCVYVPGVGFKALQGIGVFTDASSNDSAPAAFTNVGGMKATYTVSISAVTALAAQTDVVIVRGSATKLIKIIHAEVSGAATAATSTVWFMKKHTVANTGGSGTAAVITKHDSADAAATAVVQAYNTTLPTIDATASNVRTIRIDLAILPAASAVITDRYTEDFGDFWEPIVLRGVAQEFAFNAGGGTIPAGEVFDYTITWTEE
jgi:hypothetical protein